MTHGKRKRSKTLGQKTAHLFLDDLDFVRLEFLLEFTIIINLINDFV